MRVSQVLPTNGGQLRASSSVCETAAHGAFYLAPNVVVLFLFFLLFSCRPWTRTCAENMQTQHEKPEVEPLTRGSRFPAPSNRVKARKTKTSGRFIDAKLGINLARVDGLRGFTTTSPACRGEKSLMGLTGVLTLLATNVAHTCAAVGRRRRRRGDGEP